MCLGDRSVAAVLFSGENLICSGLRLNHVFVIKLACDVWIHYVYQNQWTAERKICEFFEQSVRCCFLTVVYMDRHHQVMLLHE